MLAACAPQRPLPAEYTGRALEGKTLAIALPDTSAITVADEKELALAFPRSAPTSAPAVLSREFNEYFYAEMERSVDFAKPVRVPDSLPPAPEADRIRFARQADADGPAFAYAIPGRAYLRAHGIEADLVLLVQALKSDLGRDEFIAPKMGGSIKTNYLRLDGWYILWDYAGGKPVCEGRFRSRADYRSQPDTGDWMKAFSAAVRTVMEASPFRGAKWYNAHKD